MEVKIKVLFKIFSSLNDNWILQAKILQVYWVFRAHKRKIYEKCCSKVKIGETLVMYLYLPLIIWSPLKLLIIKLALSSNSIVCFLQALTIIELPQTPIIFLILSQCNSFLTRFFFNVIPYHDSRVIFQRCRYDPMFKIHYSFSSESMGSPSPCPPSEQPVSLLITSSSALISVMLHAVLGVKTI